MWAPWDRDGSPHLHPARLCRGPFMPRLAPWAGPSPPQPELMLFMKRGRLEPNGGRHEDRACPSLHGLLPELGPHRTLVLSRAGQPDTR